MDDTRFTEQELSFLDDCNGIFEEKRQCSKEMNNVAKSMAEQLQVDKSVLIKCKDYHHYYQNAWGKDEQGNDNPLYKVKGEKFPDRIAPAFIKLYEIVSNLIQVGDLELLNPYLEAIAAKGINIEINLPQSPKSEIYDEWLSIGDEYQIRICSLADELRDEKSDMADSSGIISKSEFNRAVKMYNTVYNEKSPDKDIVKLSLASSKNITYASKMAKLVLDSGLEE